jgi:hypothetical protein
MPSASTNFDVFVNCPFDSDYKQQFDALLFVIYDCGFYPRCGLERIDSGQSRFSKICDLIRNCPYAIHDVSRIEVNSSTHLPRFNMALELGIFLGANMISEIKKPCLVMESEQYRYQRFCSDLSGFDISAHGGEVLELICVVRDFLRTLLDQDIKIPGGAYIFGRYKEFLEKLPELCDAEHMVQGSLSYNDYISFVQGWTEQRRLSEQQTT